MRHVLAGCLVALVVGGCTTNPQVPTCTITPEPAKVKDVYTVTLTHASPGTAVVLRLNNSDGTSSTKTLVISNAGTATYSAIARAAGITVVEIVETDNVASPVLNTCVLHVADAVGCGDGVCSAATEDCSTCSDDCGACEASCGDGLCSANETCTSCAADCGGCTVACGDGTCNATESCQSCPADCDVCAATCGNKVCDSPPEACTTCPGDCGACAPACGDGTCNGTETCTSCAGDCGTCPASCGNKACDNGETCTTCPGDCGTCAPRCGDAVCNGTETCTTCLADCGACAPKCGDLLCNGTETCTTCAGDCGACEACDPPATSLPNGKHYPGSGCIAGCHVAGGKAPRSPFTVAGTAYNTVGGGAVVSGATINITDAKGTKLKMITASNGNFYTDRSVTPPLKVSGSKCPAVKPMNGEVLSTGLDCNVCHKASNRIFIQ